jgi:hypothetical protein
MAGSFGELVVMATAAQHRLHLTRVYGTPLHRVFFHLSVDSFSYDVNVAQTLVLLKTIFIAEQEWNLHPVGSRFES